MRPVSQEGHADSMTAHTPPRRPPPPAGGSDFARLSKKIAEAGLVIDNARRFGRQRAVAEAMQRNLLAPLPRLGRLQLAARYQPAPAGSQVGGDRYDAFELKDGTLALVRSAP
jgi:hypothetical protein